MDSKEVVRVLQSMRSFTANMHKEHAALDFAIAALERELSQYHDAAHILIDAIGAPGPETLAETCARAVARIRGLEAQLKVASDDWDDLNVRSGERIHELENRIHLLEAKARVYDCAP